MDYQSSNAPECISMPTAFANNPCIWNKVVFQSIKEEFSSFEADPHCPEASTIHTKLQSQSLKKPLSNSNNSQTFSKRQPLVQRKLRDPSLESNIESKSAEPKKITVFAPRLRIALGVVLVGTILYSMVDLKIFSLRLLADSHVC